MRPAVVATYTHTGWYYFGPREQGMMVSARRPSAPVVSLPTMLIDRSRLLACAPDAVRVCPGLDTLARFHRLRFSDRHTPRACQDAAEHGAQQRQR